VHATPNIDTTGQGLSQMATAPQKLVANSCCTSASSPSSTAARYPYLALFTSTSTPPKWSSGCRAACVTCSRSGHVERESKGGVRVRLREVLHIRGVAGGDNGVISALKHRLGEGAAEACRAAGDEPCRHGSVACLSVLCGHVRQAW